MTETIVTNLIRVPFADITNKEPLFISSGKKEKGTINVNKSLKHKSSQTLSNTDEKCISLKEQVHPGQYWKHMAYKEQKMIEKLMKKLNSKTELLDEMKLDHQELDEIYYELLGYAQEQLHLNSTSE